MEKKKKTTLKENYFCARCETSFKDLIENNIQLFRVGDNLFECQNCAPSVVENTTKKSKIRHPRDVYSILDQHLAGQEDLKMTLSMAIFNHLNRDESREKIKNNIMICGPSGTGKTEAMRVISEQLDIPVLFVDITEYSSPGYQGRNVHEIIDSYFHLCYGDENKMSRGIIFIDELDKKSQRGINSGEVATSMVQDSLLKMIEGHEYSVNYKDEKGINRIKTVDSSKILFVGAGAFDGLKLSSQKVSVGLNSATQKATNNSPVSSDELRKAINEYGLKNELIRRFPNITTTVKLTKEDLIEILSKKSNSVVHEFENRLKKMNIDARINQAFIEKVALMSMNSSIPMAFITNLFTDIQKELAFKADISGKVDLNKVLENMGRK